MQRSDCRACGNSIQSFMDLGEQYLSDFRSDYSKPNRYPLTLARCNSCTLVQLTETVPRDELYHQNYGYRSGVNDGIVADLKSIAELGLRLRPKARSWLDIASNDGTLLSFVPEKIYRVGYDPVAKFATEASRHADIIVSDYFESTLETLERRFDVITSISMFYDVDNLNHFCSEVAASLTHDGIWIIQQNYLGAMFATGAVDNVCHEHLTYFSVQSLRALLLQHGLDIYRIDSSSINGGVIRTVVVPVFDGVGFRKWPLDPTVQEILDREEGIGLNESGACAQFNDAAQKHLRALHRYVDDRVSGNEVGMIYGASTRGAVLWQAAGIYDEHVSAAVERQSEKVGKVYSPLGIPIISEEEMRRMKPDYLLVGPWWHKDLFVEREQEYLDAGGVMVFPLPELQEVRK